MSGNMDVFQLSIAEYSSDLGSNCDTIMAYKHFSVTATYITRILNRWLLN